MNKVARAFILHRSMNERPSAVLQQAGLTSASEMTMNEAGGRPTTKHGYRTLVRLLNRTSPCF
jgi:hypothetical protein